MFKVKTVIENDLPILRIHGEITATAEAEMLACYRDIPEQKKKRVIFDFSDTSFINSAGISILINLISRASGQNYSVEFAGLNDHFRKVMDIVGLSDFVTIHPTLEMAMGEVVE